ncbi:hypothetical protein VC83_09262 [Pseudogymnoascus destructans]|uniref:Uncharacterized protein n=2 Tax=Pseudogymnoascus destructans TaxID=655981 RepID=L8FWA2_PSED2|nr:uncharacterized protein VC83_09262 [Pseudogymnoascus destructans]ELR04041.1 hypothetical protein GMDG_06552 [Pseudogymnoascus destructans 20631-21]OAF54507.1 hypothetical protein VC83_09262 [Pseudogymnoascus destructans]
MVNHYPNNLYNPYTCVICRGEVIVGRYGSQTITKGKAAINDDPRASPHARKSHQLLWYHENCYYNLASTYTAAEVPDKRKIREFYEATNSAYPAPRYKKGIRESMREGLLFGKHTKVVLKGCFSQALLRRLPEEVLRMILRYLGECRWLIVLGETRRLFDLWERGCEDRCERVTTSKPVFLTRIEFRGVSYISKISNVPFGKPSDEGFPGELLGLPPNTRRLIVSKDHMGIRNIRPIVDGLELSADGSAWYEVFGEPNASLDAEIEVLYNGFFLRRVRSTTTDRSPEMGPWSIPCPPLVSPYNMDCIESLKRGHNWLHYTQLDAGVKGLTVCRFNDHNIGFHPFTGLSVDYRRFISHVKQQYSDSFLTWMYFPINPGESITDVWTRKYGTVDGYWPSCGPSIVLETSLRRTVTFGAYIPSKDIHRQPISQMRPHQSRSLLRSSDGAISGIFHNGFDPISPYITEFGVICDSHRARKPTNQIPSSELYLYPTPPFPRELFTYGYHHDEWYLTKAPVEGLTGVQFCQDKEQRNHPRIGLILHYSDGHIESLGQFRWDLTVSDIIAAPIRIEICRDEDERYYNHPYIGAVETIPPFNARGEERKWQDIPNHGVLVWWNNPRIGEEIALYES